MASAGARAYNGGLGALPPAGSRGRAPGQGVQGGPWSWKHFNTEEGKFGTVFEVKRLKRGTKYACEQETNLDKLTHSKWDYYRLGLLSLVFNEIWMFTFVIKNKIEKKIIIPYAYIPNLRCWSINLWYLPYLQCNSYFVQRQRPMLSISLF